MNQWKKSEEESSTYSTSDENESGDKFKDKIIANNGDIYTKVAMPRSKSFMKMNNSQSSTNYNLQDLFKELKEQVSQRSVA